MKRKVLTPKPTPKVGEYWEAISTESLYYVFLVVLKERFNRKPCWLCVKCDGETFDTLIEDPRCWGDNVGWFNHKLESGTIDDIGESFFKLTRCLSGASR